MEIFIEASAVIHSRNVKIVYDAELISSFFRVIRLIYGTADRGTCGT